MVSTYTTNKNLEKPGNGDYVDTWNVPLNADMNVIDQAFGGVTSLNATAGSAVLADTEYRSLFLNISGGMSAGVTYTIPSGVAGQWIVYNSTTDSSGGPWTVTVDSGGGGTSVTVPRLLRIIIICDGTNVRALSYITDNGTVTGNLTVTGDVSVGGTLTATTALSSATVSDTIGNVRNVPINTQAAPYTLLATDNCKVVSISTGGVTVPASVFSGGNTVTIYNNSSSSQTITQGGGLTLRQVGTANTGNRTLAQRGLCTVVFLSATDAVITGGGLT